MADENKKAPTWWDHHELTYWLWACLRDAHEYLQTSAKSKAALDALCNPGLGKSDDPRKSFDLARREESLAAYHFLTSLGVLIRVLARSQQIFPQIQPSYSAAKHLLAEGKELRDMVEHAFGIKGYLEGSGRHPDKFVRTDGGISADAVSTIIKDDGHWLGNRLCVERIIAEASAIQEVVSTIEVPRDERH